MSIIHQVVAALSMPPVGTWYDNVDPSLATSETTGSYSGQMFAGLVSAPVSGTLSKIRFRCATANGPKTGKIAVLTTSGAIVGSGAYSGAVSNSFAEANVSPSAYSAGVILIVMYSASSAVADTARYRAGQANQGRQNYDQTYASFPTGTVTLANTNDQMCVGLYVT